MAGQAERVLISRGVPRGRCPSCTRVLAISAAASAAVLAASAGRSSASTVQAYCAITGTFSSSADSVDVNFSFGGAGSLLLAGHSDAGGTNVGGVNVPGGGVDSELRLFDAGGNFLAGDANGGPGAAPLLSVHPLAPSTYRAQSHLADPSRALGNGGWSMDVVADQFLNIHPPILSGSSSSSLPVINDLSIGANFGAATCAFSSGSMTIGSWHINDGGEGIVSGGTLTAGAVTAGLRGTNESDLLMFNNGWLVVRDRLLVQAGASLGLSGSGGIDLTRGRFIYEYDGPSLAGFVQAYISFGRN